VSSTTGVAARPSLPCPGSAANRTSAAANRTSAASTARSGSSRAAATGRRVHSRVRRLLWLRTATRTHDRQDQRNGVMNRPAHVEK